MGTPKPVLDVDVLVGRIPRNLRNYQSVKRRERVNKGHSRKTAPHSELHEAVAQIEHILANAKAYEMDEYEVRRFVLFCFGVDLLKYERLAQALYPGRYQTFPCHEVIPGNAEKEKMLLEFIDEFPEAKERAIRSRHFKWYYWDTIDEMSGAFENASTPYSVLCKDCGSMMKALTTKEMIDLSLKIPNEPCLECNDDPRQNISAQFAELS